MTTIEEHPAGVRIQFSSEVDGAEILKINEEVLARYASRDNFFSIWDYGETEKINFSKEQFQDLVATDKSQAGVLTKRKVAILVTNDFLFGLARMYQLHLNNTPWEIQVFRDMSEVRPWVGLT